ncbi:hypothetical protein ACFXG1_08680 [Streptomyces sp. NPDC059248]|uniref:hypothetical protein n=1 Tax=Streptomyces sp. NPDC059248 TaxID=3346791 RepID=UPI0036CA5BA0
MSIRKMFATVAAVAAVAGAGLMAAPTAQAAESGASASASASAVQPTRWVPWGSYANVGQCWHAGNWAVMNAGASYFTCSYNATTTLYDLHIWRP